MLSRGPDDAGLHVAPGIGLAHRRLSVIDLSPSGRMPMADAEERAFVVYNGEIYNHAALRAQLEAAGRRFRTRTDTEVLVHGFLEWGTDLFARLDGMFAVAIWDTASRSVVLARDPAGEKPLYYAQPPDTGLLLFGSTLDSLTAWPHAWALDDGGVTDYLSFGFVRSPRTIVAGVERVEPGTVLRFDSEGAPRPTRYWSMADQQHDAGVRESLDVDALDSTLYEAVASRMEADVPLGAFLSGGVDSSLVCAMMARARPRGVRTFTIGFEDPRFDESAHAQAVARHLGIENITQVLSEQDVAREIPEVVAALDEPMADYSALPTLAVARLARRELTVALTGDGADELFGGYRYYSALAAFTWWARLPSSARARLAASSAWLPASPRVRRIIERSAVATPAEFFGRSGFYRGAVLGRSFGLLTSHRQPPDPAQIVASFVDGEAGRLTAVEAGMLWDATTTLPEAWLCKVDRAAMAVSLETRAPFLARSVQRLAGALPLNAKVRIRERKVALRRLLRRYLPAALIDRPKQGFTPPMARWMRSILQEDIRDLARESRLVAAGHLSQAGLSTAVGEHLANEHDHAQALWAVLLLERWLQRRGLG